jgi:hypothetical protein
VSQAGWRINNVIPIIITTIYTLQHVRAARNYPHDGVIIPSSEDKP